jgi:hypothetical protein
MRVPLCATTADGGEFKSLARSAKCRLTATSRFQRLFTKLSYQTGSLPNGLVGESLCCHFVRSVTVPGTQEGYILTPHKLFILVFRIADSPTCLRSPTRTGWPVNTAAARIFE